MNWLDEFLAVFGNFTVADAVMVIMALVFCVACYKKVAKYFAKKAEAEVKRAEAEAKRAEADEKLREDVKKCLDETAKYPEYRNQSLKIQQNLEDSIKNLAVTVDENEVKRLKSEILNFASSLRCGEVHTYDDFRNIIGVHDDYNRLLHKLKRENGHTTEAFGSIMKVFHELMESGEFSMKKE